MFRILHRSYSWTSKEKYGFEAVSFEGVEDVLEELSKVYSLAVLTNGRTRCQNAKLDSLGIRDLFEVVKISEEFGLKKPDSRIFESCLSDLGCVAESVVCIGDNPDNDLLPAMELGMKVIWVRNSHFQAPSGVDAVIGSVASIGPALSKILK